MIRRPPRSTLDRSSAASDVYKRQDVPAASAVVVRRRALLCERVDRVTVAEALLRLPAVSYTHLRAHETVLDLVCRLLLEKTQTMRSLATLPCIQNNKNDRTQELL